MVHPSLVEGWLIDQERERAEEELDRNRKRVRPDSVPLPNKSNRRGRRSRLNESFADASKHEDRTAPQGLVLRRSTRRTRATKNSSLSNAAQLAKPRNTKRPSALVEAITEAPDPPTTVPSAVSANTNSSDSSGKRRRLLVAEQRKNMQPNIHNPSQAGVYFSKPGGHLSVKEVPEDVRAFVRRFCEGSVSEGCIPEELKSTLRENYPMESFMNYLFSSELGNGTKMLEMVESILSHSLGLKAKGGDEGAWSELVREVFRHFGRGENSYFAAEDVTGKLLSKALYPNLQSSKIDLALVLDNSVASFFQQIATFPEHIPLSAFDDPVTKGSITVLGVEIKSSGGRPLAEAETQLAVWAVRTGRIYLDWVEFSEQKNKRPASTKIKPIIGVTVVGSSWSYYVAYLASDAEFTNTYVLLGEYPIGNTNTVTGIFKIAKFLSLIRDWSMEELWPWCVELLGEKRKKKAEPIRPARPVRQVRLNKSGKQGTSARRS